MLRLLSTLMVATMVCASLDARGAEPHARRVRGATPLMARVIQDGIARSATFARLVAELERGDLFVYVDVAHVLPAEVDAQLSFVGASHSQYRYVRIQVRADAATNDRLALLGHELQHAVEVAASPEVRDERGLERLYRRIGESRRYSHEFDTVAARAAGRQVFLELWGGSGARRAGPRPSSY